MVIKRIVSNKKIVNPIIGFISQVIIIVMGFLVPRIILTHYGSDTNGLTNTITQVFAYVSLLESGIGQATQNELYKYVHNNNKEKISEVMSSSRKYYKKVSLLYLLVVVLISIALPFIFVTDVSNLTISIYILFEGLTSLISFYYISLYNVLLSVYGKSYITNIIATCSKIFMYIIKIVLALKKINIALIQIGYFLVSLLQLFIYSIYMKKKYGWIDYSKNSKYHLSDKNSYVITEVAWTIFSSTDMIILSIFLSTKMSSVYSVYAMIYNSLNSLIDAIFSSVKYELGNTYYNSNDNRYIKIHNLYNSVFLGLTTAVMCTAYILTPQFIFLYTRGVNDVNYNYEYLPLLFCLVQLLSRSRTIAGNLTGIAGFAKKVSKISVLEAILNILLSIILVNLFNIYGVIIATICSLSIKVIYVNYIADIKVLNNNICNTCKIFFSNFIIFLFTIVIERIIIVDIKSYFVFAVKGFEYLIIYLIICVIINIFANRDIHMIIKEKLNEF